ncbi:MAG TPA: flagellar hook-associated protein FlgL [Candidatus Sulfotelmatobacter sp.]|nr:flagellar hook-associated protein FlgL [Candidatus Sulfotelmatobacter sp.]
MSLRVDPNIIPDILAGLNTTRQQLNTADLQLASGRTINQPSDNPAGTAALVLNHVAQSQNDTFQSNVSTLQTSESTADSALNSAENVIDQAISLGVQAGDSNLSDQQRAAIATQLQGIQQQLISIANTNVGGSYLFAGTDTQTAPFVADGASPAGVDYVGNEEVASVELNNNQSVNVNVPGDQLFLNPSGSLLGSLNQLITAVQTNTNIQGASTALGTAATEFTTQRLTYGSVLNQLQSASTLLNNQEVQLQTQEQSLSGADLATVETNFSQAQIAYTSLLDAESHILTLPTLLSLLA